ncbi:MAG: ATPase [Deltaproteobacteria bacterium CG_4_10_14_3_um_filter_60_8]|nr:MAG: ATPase [Desulfobacterales bacterium CG2_30_60_27]PIP43624.1 MAG: ATPase [Deltaproteobacteria bacterium CG23_combo_of_CG06-09_8_20_14_all_60_8]PIY23830.1 MAG: ATPase [Deltaproteobacteria bacterium CG_4_10_14_3_um_filter_60_8]
MDTGPRGRKDTRLIKEKRNDAYKCKDKLPDFAHCANCGATFVGGRWTWAAPDPAKTKVICPACQRCADNFPAGYVEMKGDFFDKHRAEIISLSRNIENQEREPHPMERIMAIHEAEDHTLLTTTGVHLARRIGDALAQSFKGTYAFHYADGEQKIRVYWER